MVGVVKKYELVLFDFDGTLGDTLPWFQQAFQVVGEKHGFKKLDKAEYDKLRDCDGRQILKTLGVPFWKVPLLAKEMRSLMAANLRETKLFPMTGIVLDKLSAKGIAIGIVSSNSEENIRAMLGPESAKHIRYYEGGVSMFGKASKLKKVIRQSGAQREKVIYIGDELRDLQAARAAGIAFGAVSWGYNRAEALQRQAPDELFFRMEQILECL